MLFLDFKVDKEVYKLRLTTRNVISLEAKYGCSPLALFEGEQIPKISVLADILHAALQTYHHSISLDDTHAIIDTWVEQGNSLTDLIYVVLELFKVSGIIPKDVNIKNPGKKEKTEKN